MTKTAEMVPAAPAYEDILATQLSQRRVSLSFALADLQQHPAALSHAATLLVSTLRSGHAVLAAGNGGSAAEAQHFAAELVGRFRREREPYPVLALSTDSSVLTAVANDYGYEQVFARQIRAHGRPGDLLIAFSTSGESENLVRAAETARQRGMSVIGVTGKRASRLERAADVTVRAAVTDTAVVQELHMAITHLLCDLAEQELAREASG
ncbi:MAG TPA: SIS domain-containing protein [Chloroflexota bacterium]|nr:SIS domain-containing protein [Chloroflexota bacterium]